LRRSALLMCWSIPDQNHRKQNDCLNASHSPRHPP
jgi:hypothetical protein